MKKRRRAMLLSIVLLIGMISGCIRKIDGETAEQFKARKKAIYSAQIVTGLAGLSDLNEILVDGQVIDRAGGASLTDINDRALAAADILRERLKTGFDAGAIGKFRDAIADIEKARAAGVIRFKSTKAQEFYFGAVATVEVSLNLIEALQAGQREPSVRSAQDKAIQRLQVGSDEPKWWNRAIVKAAEIARIMAAQGALDTSTAWADADARSANLHAKNKALLETWKS
jgi:hypothetical protein